jgi:ribonuclease T2
MKRTLPLVMLLVVLSLSFAGTGYAKHKKGQSQSSSDNTPGQFDYYLLTLSWAPQFCATNPNGRSSLECSPSKHMGLVVHGLWPQYNNGSWPQDCSSTPPVSQSTVNHMLPMMPDKSLIQHEWEKHGTCSGLSMKDYFGAIEKVYSGLKVPDEFKRPSDKAESNPGDIEAAFASANNAPKAAFRVTCPQQDFSAVQMCLDKDFQYMACPTTQKDCRANQIQVRPVP